MENASKALLIAGAILIAIVLISLGVMILGQGADLVNNADMSEAEIAEFNKPFEGYLGSNVRGNKVRLLISKINQNNRSNSDDASKQVKVGDTAWASNLENTTGSPYNPQTYGTGNAYSVVATYSTSNLIEKITITKK